MHRTMLPIAMLLVACSGTAPSEPAPEPTPPPAPSGPAPTLILGLSPYEVGPSGVETQPARAVLLRQAGATWAAETFEDPESNVFHKVIPWRDGLLTIGGDKARVLHWTRTDGTWTPTVLWQASFGGEHDRMRDVEEGDVDGDGEAELVVATHDRGIVAIGDEADGAWTFTQVGARPSTFVHEIELGDLDGDGIAEIYATPSEPNQSSGASQPGRVERWTHTDEGYVQTTLIAWEDTHAKEITLADLGQGPVLLALREGRTGPGGALTEPVTVVRLVPGEGEAWTEAPLATLPGEPQARFLVPGDVDHDGFVELVVTGMKTGVWLLDREEPTGPWQVTQVDGSSGGFEQAAHVADLDGDGQVELYVVSEPTGKPRQVRRYTWQGGAASRTVLHTLPGQGLAWSLSHGTL